MLSSSLILLSTSSSDEAEEHSLSPRRIDFSLLSFSFMVALKSSHSRAAHPRASAHLTIFFSNPPCVEMCALVSNNARDFCFTPAVSGPPRTRSASSSPSSPSTSTSSASSASLLTCSDHRGTGIATAAPGLNRSHFTSNVFPLLSPYPNGTSIKSVSRAGSKSCGIIASSMTSPRYVLLLSSSSFCPNAAATASAMFVTSASSFFAVE
mmetsp:Transcript_10436/g.37791  ORF Transcript_10436/g.37791 Transcript_10436/m.37791 type:complete len:209 (-) Transcript_10436:353-979(-)